MTFEQFIGFALISLMMGIVFLATQFVASAENNGKGLWYNTMRAVYWGDYKYREWLKNNTVYWWCVLLIICLCITIIGLIPPFREGKIYLRPFITLVVSIPLWISIFYTYKWFFKKIRSK